MKWLFIIFVTMVMASMATAQIKIELSDTDDGNVLDLRQQDDLSDQVNLTNINGSLNDLNDVTILVPSNNDILNYNFSANMWENHPADTLITDFNKTNICFVNNTNVFEEDQFFNSRINFSNETFLFYNDTNATVMLIANGQLQQSWGASTYFPGKAEFANNLTVQGDTNLQGNTFFSNLSGNDAIIDSNLNVTGNITSFANYFGGFFKGAFSWMIKDDGTSTKYLQFNSTDLSFNETKLNASIETIINETLSGDLTIEGNLSGTFFFGDMFTSNETTIILPGLNDPVNITGITGFEQQNGFVFDGDHSLMQNTNKSGIFQMIYSISFTGGSNEQYRFAITNDGVKITGTTTIVTLTSGGSVQTVAGTGVARIEHGETLTIIVEQDTTPIKDITYFSVSMNVVRIGN